MNLEVVAMTRFDGIEEIEPYFRADKSVLLDLFPGPDYYGSASWLWMPRKKGNPRVCLVAHIDTVFARPPRMVLHDSRHGVYWSPDGLGADDRAGVYACNLLRQHTGCMVLLTDGEERGGIGAHEACQAYPECFNNIRLFVEIDRRGRAEMVFYAGEPPEFRRFIGGFGFHERNGSFSDISVLVPNFGIPGVNLSVGYYGQHSTSEYLVTKHLYETITKTIKILEVDYANKKWDLPVYPEFGGNYDAGNVSIYNRRCRKSQKVVGGGAVFGDNWLSRDL
jgi:hypothetical protein